MHGEYKAPGGKLVAVDLEVTVGRLRNVVVSGDFFLEPDGALERIDAILEGMPADAEASRIAARIEAELPADVVMVGLTPHAIAVAVRRALSRATNWEDHKWRLIHTGPQEPALHMALDEVLTREVVAGRRPPTLRVWEWASSAVIIGTFQSMRNEVDAAAAARHGITVVRRISGGGAMFVEPGNTITYSLHAPGSLVQGLSFVDSYAFLDDWVLAALTDLGIEARYEPINDITSPAGKIAGAAQKRFASGGLLHHVTMAYDIDAAKMTEVVRIGREKLSDKGTASAQKRVDPLRSQTSLPRAAIIDRMVATFRQRYRLADDELRPEELRNAEKLVANKFNTAGWTARIP
jgi:lipoate-protein ligase A